MRNSVDASKKLGDLSLADLEQFITQITKGNDAITADLPTPKIHKTAAVFQGGGAKGAAFAGAMDAYGDFGVYDELTQAMGSSAGALTAFLIAIGLDHKQFKAVSLDTRICDLKDADDSGYFGKYAIANLYWGVAAGGMSTGNNARILINYLMKQTTGKADCTFLEFENFRIYGKTNPTEDEITNSEYNPLNPSHPEMKQFICTAYHHTKEHDFYFSKETFPDVIIADALYCSMSLPPVFPSAPIRFRTQTGETGKIENGSHFRDGGIADNFPLRYLNKILTGKEDAAASSELIGFGFADTSDLAMLAADENYAKNIPQDTIQKLGIKPAAKRLSNSEKDIPVTTTTTTTKLEDKPLITSIQQGIYSGALQLYGYHKVNQKGLLETQLMLQYPDSTIPLYNADIQAHQLDINNQIINTLVNYGYAHTAHWINNNLQYSQIADSPATACPVALDLLTKYQALAKDPQVAEEDIKLLLAAVCTEIIKESKAFKQHMSNLPDIELDCTKNIRLNFLGNLLSKLKLLALTQTNLDANAFHEIILNLSKDILSKDQQLQLHKQKNREILFAKVDLDLNIVFERLKAGILDTSEGADERFLEMFSYLLSRSYEILNSIMGQELLALAQENKQFKKIEHMMHVAMHNLMMMSNRFPLSGAKEYFMGYFTRYETSINAEQSKKSIAAMLNSMMLDAARTGDLTVGHLETFISLGFTNLGVNIAIQDNNKKNVLHYCFANAKTLEDVKLLMGGLGYLSKHGSFKAIMDCQDKFGNTPMDYLNPAIFFNPEITHLIMNSENTKTICNNMINNNISKGKILYSAVNSQDIIFCQFILKQLQDGIRDRKINPAAIIFDNEQESVFLCAARHRKFDILKVLTQFRIDYSLHRTAKEHNLLTNSKGRNPLHYMMKHAATKEHAHIILDFIHEGRLTYSLRHRGTSRFSEETRNLLTARDQYNKTPLHYLLENTTKPAIIQTIFTELASSSSLHANLGALGPTWHIDEIVDYKVNATPMFTTIPNQYDHVIAAACKNFSVTFVEENIIKFLSEKVKTHFATMREAYVIATNVSKPLTFPKIGKQAGELKTITEQATDKKDEDKKHAPDKP